MPWGAALNRGGRAAVGKGKEYWRRAGLAFRPDKFFYIKSYSSGETLEGPVKGSTHPFGVGCRIFVVIFCMRKAICTCNVCL